jgi:acyl-[acyl-carrier-protein]-phospholipid O-acyltransferase/long-chain-fatty-acid--[acyl-carrier-protein] ligase
MSYDAAAARRFALGRRLAARTGRASASACCCRPRSAAGGEPSSRCRSRAACGDAQLYRRQRGLDAALAAAEIRLVVTARRFVEQAKLGALVEALATEGHICSSRMSARGSAVAARLAALHARRWCRRATIRRASPRRRRRRVVLFTSGSEGHAQGRRAEPPQPARNRHQLGAVLDIHAARRRARTRCRMFHSFGLTGGLLLPLLSGRAHLLYPSPLHYGSFRRSPTASTRTILFGTDTFLAGYARVADPGTSTRCATSSPAPSASSRRRAQTWFDKFGIRLLEGYGATETAPGSRSTRRCTSRPARSGGCCPASSTGSSRCRAIATAARWSCSGPNVMLGYLRAEKPGRAGTAAGGWYDTGDIVALGRCRLRDDPRAAPSASPRSPAKMVPLDAVEEAGAQDPGPDSATPSSRCPDAKRGESS